MYIAVSGNLGSGKTTVARGLAKAFGCDVYPRRSYNRSYIEDLFREPARWTTEAQISFMVHKHDEVRAGLDSGKLFILDRSFDEEVEVFAARFHDDGMIDDRSMDLIRRLAADLRLRQTPPDLIVFCDCPVPILRERLLLRPRSYQDAYPPDHLSMLDGRLTSWLREQSVTVVTADTVAVDYREQANALTLARRIDFELARTRSNQLDLFDEAEQDSRTSSARSLLRRRQVYLAAPFTAHAQKHGRLQEGSSLFSAENASEEIPSAYRRRLTGIARAIESHGHEVLLPHRDINRWGKRSMPGSDVARKCLAAVAEADCFVGLIAESFGSHAELAYALALAKPSLVLLSARETTSFFGQGMASLPGVGVLAGNSIAALTKSLKATDPLTRMTWS
ncbi:deoxynucleoside kinase [Sphingomonas sp. 22L2VL55-3]